MSNLDRAERQIYIPPCPWDTDGCSSVKCCVTGVALDSDLAAGDPLAGVMRMHCFDSLTAITRISVTITTHPRILNTSGFAI